MIATCGGADGTGWIGTLGQMRDGETKCVAKGFLGVRKEE